MTPRMAQPLRLRRAAHKAGVCLSELPACQLILATADGSGAALRCYEKSRGGVWRTVRDIGAVAGHVGRNGITYAKKEGDGCTPAGFYRLGFAFGRLEKPATKMPYRPVTENSFWVDDPKSGRYNTWVENGKVRDWASAERLWDYGDSYAYAVVIEYNTRHPVPGNGSAVFLHCGTRPTAGCVAVPPCRMLALLSWLDPAASPGILITGR